MVGGWGGGCGGRGGAWGRRGARHRHWFYATGLPRWARSGPWAAPEYGPSPADETDMLRQEAAALQNQLEAIQARLDELSEDSGESGA
jgi:hypothetical protein